jgi:AraC-like DNA-binding protein
MFKADGWSDERIAAHLGISRTTLLKHFGAELETGADDERAFALRKLREAADKLNVAAIKEYLRVVSVGGALDQFEGEAARKPRIRPKGKKEIAQEEALRAHEASDWGEDLAPLPDPGRLTH